MTIRASLGVEGSRVKGVSPIEGVVVVVRVGWLGKGGTSSIEAIP